MSSAPHNCWFRSQSYGSGGQVRCMCPGRYPNQRRPTLAQILHLSIQARLKPTELGWTAGSGPNRIEVVHRYGACAPGQNPNQRGPTLDHILHLDQLRAESIQARLKPSHQFMESKDQQANLPVHFQSDDVALDSVHHIVKLNLDQLNQSLSLALDTGRGPTFTQTCSPGSSYTPIRCNEIECLEVDQETLVSCDDSNPCDYQLQVGVQVVNNGTLSKVNLTGFPDFVLGCGRTATGALPLFGDGVDGELGLGKGELSFVSQTNNARFSYCLPSSSTSTGYLKLGENNNDALLSFTPFAHPPAVSERYFVHIVAITVGGTQLKIDYQSDIPGTFIDTRLLITQLPPAAYGPMRDEFRRQMGTYNYTVAGAFSMLDTCYDTTNQASITAPPVSFTFKNNVTVDLDVSGVLYVVNSTLSCFAFARTNDTTAFAIFGSAQQRTLEMVFDVANDKLGIRRNGCA